MPLFEGASRPSRKDLVFSRGLFAGIIVFVYLTALVNGLAVGYLIKTKGLPILSEKTSTLPIASKAFPIGKVSAVVGPEGPAGFTQTLPIPAPSFPAKNEEGKPHESILSYREVPAAPIKPLQKTSGEKASPSTTAKKTDNRPPSVSTATGVLKRIQPGEYEWEDHVVGR